MSNTRDDGGLVGEPIGMNDLFAQELDIQHHDTYDRHEFGKSFPIPGAPAPIGTTGKPGSSLAPARADHTHAFPASMVRNVVIGSSPVLSSTGDFPGVLGSLNPVPVVASQINIAAAAYTRFIIMSASFRASVPTAASPTPASIGVEVLVSQAGGAFTSLFNKLAAVAAATPNTLGSAYAQPDWTGIMQLNANTTYAFQLAAFCSHGTGTITPQGARMFYQITPQVPVG